MTETDKAREWLDSQRLEEDLRSTTTNWYGPMSANNLAKLLAAYGAAQYEAGAAQMRERAAKKLRGAATAPSAPPTREFRPSFGCRSGQLKDPASGQTAEICFGHCDRCNAVCLSKASPTINRAINAALKNASGGESPLSEQTQDFNKVFGLPVVFVVEGSHSRTAFFNRTEAERYLAERKQPERFAIVEYVKTQATADRSAPPLSNEPLAELDWMRRVAKAILHAGSWPDEWEEEDVTEIAGIIAKHLGPRLYIAMYCESDSRWLAEVPSIPGCMAYGRTQSEAVMKVGKLLEQIEAEKGGMQ